VSDSGSHKKVANGLVALGSAAVLAVYTAGYLRTKSAADRFAVQASARRPAIPGPQASAPTTIEARPSAADIVVPGVVTPSPAPSGSTRSTRRRSKDARVRRGEIEQMLAAPPSAVTVQPTTAVPTPSLPAPAAELPVAVSEPAPAASAPAPPAPPKAQYRDGTYFGWGTSRHGDIQAAVVIQDGRIASATIAQCLTRYSCSVIAKLPPQVAERQSPETDYVSGATQSTNAFYYAVVEALSKAK
jgi:uncharacterized protein with FMN-binding domain